MEQLLYKPKEVAKLFGVSLQTVYNWIRLEILSCIRPCGEIYIRNEDIEEFLHKPSTDINSKIIEARKFNNAYNRTK